MSAGSTDLEAMLATLDATDRPDQYIYAISYDFFAAWLTLTAQCSGHS